MNEKGRKMLYAQLIEMYNSEYNIKENKEEIIKEEEFMALSDADKLRYVFEYRNENTYFEIDGERCDCTISLPDIDLEGEDLTGLVLSDFRLGDVEYSSNGYVIKPETISMLNLKNTNVTINLTKLAPNDIFVDENEREHLAINLNYANFQGCKVFGILPDEYEQEETRGQGRLSSRIKVLGKDDVFDETYLNRRKENHLSEEDKKISDRVYQKLIKGESLKGMRGVGSENDRKRVNLIDYDFSEIAEDEEIKENFEDCLEDYFIDCRHTGATIVPTYFFEQEINNKIIMDEYAKGNLDFAIKYFRYLSNEIKTEIVKEEYAKGNMDFAIKYFRYLSNEIKAEIVKEEYAKGNLDFIVEYRRSFPKEMWIDIIRKEYAKGNLDFIDENDFFVPNEIMSEIVQKEYEKENINIDFVIQHFKYLTNEQQLEMINSECEHGNLEFLELVYSKNWWCNHDLMKSLMKLESKAESKYVTKKYLEKEKKEKENHGYEKVSCDGKLLYDELSKKYIDKDFILSLINAGSGVNYTGYSYYSYFYKQYEHIPSLYRALTNISDKKDRKEIVEAMLDAGANPKACFLKYYYDRYDRKNNYRKSISCMNVNSGELKEILKNRKNKIEKTNETIMSEKTDETNNPEKIDETIMSEKTNETIMSEKTDETNNPEKTNETTMSEKTNETIMSEKTDETNNPEKIDEIIKPENTNSIDMQKVIIYNYLTNQVGLNAEEIENLENVYSEYNRDLYSENIENNLDLKKKILDVCKATKQGFTKNYRILFSSPQTLYSKLKFFKEFGIEIDFENLDKTLSCSNKYFARKYGELYIEQGDMDEKEYAKLIQRKLSELYPMPKNIDEFDRELEQFREKTEEREVV